MPKRHSKGIRVLRYRRVLLCFCMKKTLGQMLIRGLRVTAVILGLAYVFWAAAIYASLAPPPHGLLWFLETYISHDGQISDPQGVLRQVMIVPGLVLSVFIIGQVTLRSFPFPGQLLITYAVFMALYYSFFRWYVMMVLGNGPFEDCPGSAPMGPNSSI